MQVGQGVDDNIFIEAKVDKNSQVRIKLSDPLNLKQDIRLEIFGRKIRVNFVNTGVPHTVVFTESLDEINVEEIGREIRFHRKFAPAGTNVDFVEILDHNLIKVRTYERGVEAETLACGTGAVASAIMASFKINSKLDKNTVKVIAKGSETLKVYFKRSGNKVSDAWLEGKAHLVYTGESSLK